MTEERQDPTNTDGAGASGRSGRERGHGLDWGNVVRNALLIVVLLVMIWLAFNVKLPTADELQRRFEAFGWAGWLAFIGLYAVVALTPIPVTVMATAAGVLFGVLEGSVLSVIGVLIGCWGAYWLARLLGRETVGKLLGTHAETIENRLENAGFQAVFVLRVLPGLPYWPVNYGSGAFGVSQRDYLAASALSVIPGQVSLVALGAFIAEPTVLGGIGVAIAWLVVLVITVWAYRQWRAADRAT